MTNQEILSKGATPLEHNTSYTEGMEDAFGSITTCEDCQHSEEKQLTLTPHKYLICNYWSNGYDYVQVEKDFFCGAGEWK